MILFFFIVIVIVLICRLWDICNSCWRFLVLILVIVDVIGNGIGLLGVIIVFGLVVG